MATGGDVKLSASKFGGEAGEIAASAKDIEKLTGEMSSLVSALEAVNDLMERHESLIRNVDDNMDMLSRSVRNLSEAASDLKRLENVRVDSAAIKASMNSFKTALTELRDMTRTSFDELGNLSSTIGQLSKVKNEIQGASGAYEALASVLGTLSKAMGQINIGALSDNLSKLSASIVAASGADINAFSESMNKAMRSMSGARQKSDDLADAHVANANEIAKANDKMAKSFSRSAQLQPGTAGVKEISVNFNAASEQLEKTRSSVRDLSNEANGLGIAFANALNTIYSNLTETDDRLEGLADQAARLSKNFRGQSLDLTEFQELVRVMPFIIKQLTSGEASSTEWTNSLKIMQSVLAKSSSLLSRTTVSGEALRSMFSNLNETVDDTGTTFANSILNKAQTAIKALEASRSKADDPEMVQQQIDSLKQAVAVLADADNIIDKMASNLNAAERSFRDTARMTEDTIVGIKKEERALLGLGEAIDKSVLRKSGAAGNAIAKLGNDMQDAAAKAAMMLGPANDEVANARSFMPVLNETGLTNQVKSLRALDSELAKLERRANGLTAGFNLLASGQSAFGAQATVVANIVGSEFAVLTTTKEQIEKVRSNIADLINTMSNVASRASNVEALRDAFNLVAEGSENVRDNIDAMDRSLTTTDDALKTAKANAASYNQELIRMANLLAAARKAQSSGSKFVVNEGTESEQTVGGTDLRIANELVKSIENRVKELRSAKAVQEDIAKSAQYTLATEKDLAKLSNVVSSVRTSNFDMLTKQGGINSAKASDLNEYEKGIIKLFEVMDKLNEKKRLNNQIFAVSSKFYQENAAAAHAVIKTTDEQINSVENLIVDMAQALNLIDVTKESFLQLARAKREAIKADQQDSAFNRNLAGQLKFADNLTADYSDSNNQLKGSIGGVVAETNRMIAANEASIPHIQGVIQYILDEIKYRSNHIRGMQAAIAVQQGLTDSEGNLREEAAKNIDELKRRIPLLRAEESELKRTQARLQEVVKYLRQFDNALRTSTGSADIVTRELNEVTAAIRRLDSATAFGADPAELSEGYITASKRISKAISENEALVKRLNRIIQDIDTNPNLPSGVAELRGEFEKLLTSAEANKVKLDSLSSSAKANAKAFEQAAKASLAYKDAVQSAVGRASTSSPTAEAEARTLGVTEFDVKEVQLQEKLLETYSKKAKALLDVSDAAIDNAKSIGIENNALQRSGLLTQDSIDASEGARRELLNRINESRRLVQVMRNVIGVDDEHDRKLRVLADIVEHNVGTMQTYASELKVLSNGQRQWNRDLQSTAEELRSTIDMQMRNMSSFMLIYGTMNLVRTATREYIEETNQLARALSASRSPALGLEERFTALESSMNEARARFGLDARQIGEALYQLGSAGLTVEQTMAGLIPTLNLVVGADANVEEMTKLMATTYNVLNHQMQLTGNQMEDMAHLADVIAVIYRDNQIEVNEFVNAMKYVIPVADQAGVSFEELAAILGTLHTQGIKAGLAGRQLRAIFYNMQQNRRQLEETFKDIGIEIDPRQPLDFLDIMRQVAGVLDQGKVSVSRMENVIQAMGIRGTGVFIQLSRSMGLLDQNIELATKHSKGQAQAIADIRMDAFAKQLDIAKQNMYLFGKEALTGVAAAAYAVVAAFNAMSDAIRAFNDLLNGIPGYMTRVVGGVIALIAIYKTLRQVILSVVAAYAVLTGAETLAAGGGIALGLKAAKASDLWAKSTAAVGASVAGLSAEIGAAGATVGGLALAVTAGVAINAAYLYGIYKLGEEFLSFKHQIEEVKDALKDVDDAANAIAISQRSQTEKETLFANFRRDAEKYVSVLVNTNATTDELAEANYRLQKLLSDKKFAEFSDAVIATAEGYVYSAEGAENYARKLEHLRKQMEFINKEKQKESFDIGIGELEDKIPQIRSFENVLKSLYKTRDVAAQKGLFIKTDTDIAKTTNKLNELSMEVVALGLRLKVIDEEGFKRWLLSLDSVPDSLKRAWSEVNALSAAVSKIPQIDVRWNIIEDASKGRYLVGDLVNEINLARLALNEFSITAGTFNSDTSLEFINTLVDSFESLSATTPELAASIVDLIGDSLDALREDFKSLDPDSLFIQDSLAKAKEKLGAQSSDSLRSAIEDLTYFNNEYNNTLRDMGVANAKYRDTFSLNTADGAVAVKASIPALRDALDLQVQMRSVSQSVNRAWEESNTLRYGQMATALHDLKVARDQRSSREEMVKVEQLLLTAKRQLLKAEEELTEHGDNATDDEREKFARASHQFELAKKEYVTRLQANKTIVDKEFEILKMTKLQLMEHQRLNIELQKARGVGDDRLDQARYELSIQGTLLGLKKQEIILSEQNEAYRQLLIQAEVTKTLTVKKNLMKEIFMLEKQARISNQEAVGKLIESLSVERTSLTIAKDIGVNYTKFSTVLEKIAFWKERGRSIVGKTKDALEQQRSVQSTIAGLENQGVENAVEHLKLLRDLQKILEEVNALWKDFVSLQRDAVREQKSLLDASYTRNLDGIRAIFENMSESRPFDFLTDAAVLLGRPVRDVSDALEEMVDLFEAGSLSASKLGAIFGDDVGRRAGEMATQLEAINTLAEKEMALTKSLAASDLNMLEQLLSTDKLSFADLGKAKELISSVLGYSREIAATDPVAAARQLELIERLAEKMAQLSAEKRDQLIIDVGLNTDKFIEQLNFMRDKYLEFIAELNSKGTLTFDFGTMKLNPGDAFESTLRRVVSDVVTRALNNGKGFATGGSVPGVGNTDTVPAMLTPGEFVIPANVVKKLGASNLYKLIAGKMSQDDIASFAESISSFRQSTVDSTKSLRRGEMSFFQFLNKQGDNDYQLYGNIRKIMGKYAGFNKGGLVGYATGGMVGSNKSGLTAATGGSLQLPADIAVTPSSAKSLATALKDAMAQGTADGLKIIERSFRAGSRKSIAMPVIEQIKTIRSAWLQQTEAMLDQTLPMFTRFGIAVGKAFNEGFTGAITSGTSAVQQFISSLFDTGWIAEDTLTNIQDKIEELAETYEDNLNALVKQLRRNEISYFQYLNKLEDLNAQHQQDLAKAAKDAAGSDEDIMQQRLNDILDAIRSGFASVVGGFSDSLIGSLTGLMETAATNAFNDIQSSLYNGIKDMVTILSTFSWDNTNIKSSVDEVKNTFGGIGDNFSKAFSGTGDLFAEWTPTAEIGDKVSGAAQWLSDSIFNVGSTALMQFNKLMEFDDVGSLDEYIVDLGISMESLTPYFDNMASYMGGFIQNVQNIFGSIDWSALKNGIASLASYLGDAIGAVSDYVGAVVGVASVFFSIGAALSALEPGKIKTLFEGNGSVADSLESTINDLVKHFVDEAPAMIDIIIANVPRIIAALEVALPKIIQSIIDMMPRIIDMLAANLPKLIALLSNGLVQVINGLAANLPQFASMIGKVLISVLNSIVKDIVPTLMTVIPQVAKALVGVIQQLGPVIGKLLGDLLIQLPGIIQELIFAALDILVALLDQLPTIIKDVLSSLPEVIRNLMDALPKIITRIAELLPVLIPALLKLMPVIAWELTKAIVVGLWEVLKGLPSLLKSILIDIPIGIANAIGETIGNMMNSLLSAIVGLPSSIASAIGDALSSVGSGVSSLWDDFVNIITNPFHNGGLVAHSGMYIQDNAGRFSRDIKADERMILAQTGEGVLSRRAMDSLGRSNFEMLNSGVPLSALAALNGIGYNYSSGLPPVINTESNTTINEGDTNEGDINITFSNCTFTSEDVATQVEQQIVQNLKTRRGELQKIIRGDSDNRHDRLMRK